MKKYKPTIGIEVHAELKTKSKMFCGCKNDPHASEPNQNTCPVCLAHPGTLPTVNKEAVKKLLMVGNAVNGKIAVFTEFDRKNYFYPDIPKAYQLSQYQFPFVSEGELADVALTRIHLEEDTARSQHSDSGSVVDFNRAGVPLMELVTEPVIHDSETAGKFARELQLLLRTLGVSDANMEKGEMRVEANISISADDTLGTKVEVKNLNSFKVMEAAIEYEVKRQAEVLEKGEQVIQETRGWDENKGKTFSQRSKEQAEEYRYFPDPDIPKMDVSKIDAFDISRIKEITPKLPSEKRIFYKNLGLRDDQIELIVSNMELESFFAMVAADTKFSSDSAQIAANYVTSDVVNLVDNEDHKLADANAKTFVALVNMIAANIVNSRVAKDLLPEVVFESKDPQVLADERGLTQSSSTDDLMPIVEQIIAENNDVVADIKGGNEKAIKFLVGQGMKLSKGSANPQVLEKLLQSNIAEM